MSENVFFSIILPTYKRVDKISVAINSVISQTYKNWELIIVDNNSNDGTKELVEKYNNEKIFFYQINNQGIIAKSRNLGIQKSKGKYLCFLDSDDWWHIKKLEHVYDSITDDTVFIYHNHYINFPNRFIKKRKINSKILNKPIFSDLLEFGPSFATSSVTVKKKIFEKIGLFDVEKKYIAWEDFDAWIRISKITDNFHKINKTLSTINVDDNNFLNDKLKIKNTRLFLDKYFLKNKKIPTWCLYNMLIAEFNLLNFHEVKKIFGKISYTELNFKQMINLTRIYFISLFK